jgi:hypothetical protein
MSSHSEIQMTEEEKAILDLEAKIGQLPAPLQDLSPEIKVALVKNDCVVLENFPTTDSGWDRLFLACGFSIGKCNLVRNRISLLQQQGK